MMKLLRTAIVFVLGMVVGYTMRTWNIELPEQVQGYVQQIESMKDDKARLEAELKKLRELIDDAD